MKRRCRSHALAIISTAVLIALTAASPARAEAQAKPNILVIWGDDIGRDNISAYSLGIMGYWTPNINRLAKERALFIRSRRWRP
jgi:hypothetical protein